MPSLISRPCGPIRGTARPPADKSISHRALIFGALAVGQTRISNLLDSDDVRRTGLALSAMGAEIGPGTDGTWRVHGVGVGGLSEPDDVVDFGNSGTAARLLMGAIAGQPIRAMLSGDDSLRRRPMGRVIEPLQRMGVRFDARDGGRLPLLIEGPPRLLPIDYRLPVASAQVKSAILLAALAAPGRTSVIEPAASRDHTENFLRHFGAELTLEADGAGGRRITLVGEAELSARQIEVPADPSSAAFAIVAALLTAGSELRLNGVNLNPLRSGLIECLREMGGDIRLENERMAQGEAVADLLVRESALKGIVVPAERAPSMIDEYPVLCVAAALAKGRTEFRGAGELRVKESDRIAATAAGLEALGVRVEALDDGMIVHGTAGPPPAGDHMPVIETHLDHRIAMAFLVFGCVARGPVAIDDGGAIATSFPDFAGFMNGLGAAIGAAQ